MMTTLVSEVFATCNQIDDGRSLGDILTHAMTELGELAQEIQIHQGKSYKQASEDGVVGEAIDLISCALDIIYQATGGKITEDDIISLASVKLAKWVEKSTQIGATDTIKSVVVGGVEYQIHTYPEDGSYAAIIDNKVVNLSAKRSAQTLQDVAIEVFELVHGLSSVDEKILAANCEFDVEDWEKLKAINPSLRAWMEVQKKAYPTEGTNE